MIKADLHVHTNFSYDGVSSPKEIVKSAIAKGIRCICVTDHGEIKGAIEAMKFGYDRDILIVPGIEILSKSGDILGINIRKKIPNKLSAKETIKEIRKQGGIAAIPHPFNKPLMGFWGGAEKMRLVSPDAIETFNASVFFSSSNKKALNFSKENNFCFTAGSDAHRKDFVGRGYIKISDNVFSEKDLVAAIMKKNIATGGERLTFWELLKNVSSANVKSMIVYCANKKKICKKAN